MGGIWSGRLRREEKGLSCRRLDASYDHVAPLGKRDIHPGSSFYSLNTNKSFRYDFKELVDCHPKFSLVT